MTRAVYEAVEKTVEFLARLCENGMGGLESNVPEDKSLLYVYRRKMTEMRTTFFFFWYKFSVISLPEAN